MVDETSGSDLYYDMLGEQAEEYRELTWKRSTWSKRPALISRDGGERTAYRGQSFDPDRFELRDNGWDHDHCEFCWKTLSETPGPDGATEGYTVDGSKWVCVRCYERIIVAAEDPEEVLRESG